MPLLTALALTIRLYDLTGLPAGTWQDAIGVASTTLQQAGIDAQWVDCAAVAPASHCQEALTAAELVLRVRHAPLHRGTQALGDAIVDPRAGRGTVATLYANRIAATAASSGVETSVVLGRALAHEVGHLLLGNPSHSPTGLMRAHWTPVELSADAVQDWRFSDAEAAVMRVGLADRAGSSSEAGGFTTVRVPRCRPAATARGPRARMRTGGPTSPCGCSRASLSSPEPPPSETPSGMPSVFNTPWQPEFSTVCSY